MGQTLLAMWRPGFPGTFARTSKTLQATSLRMPRSTNVGNSFFTVGINRPANPQRAASSYTRIVRLCPFAAFVPQVVPACGPRRRRLSVGRTREAVSRLFGIGGGELHWARRCGDSPGNDRAGPFARIRAWQPV